MTTEQTAQQLELAAQILRTGHPFEVRHDTSDRWHASLGVNPAQAVLQDWHIRLALATPPDNRPLHNPDNLTAEAVGVGYRLALKEEPPHEDAERWEEGEGVWESRGTFTGAKYNSVDTYRLPLSVPWPEPADPYAELKAAHAAGKVIQYRATRGDWSDWPKDQAPDWLALNTLWRIKPEPALQLPPPPPGMRWHREDGWKADDLPQGYRPLVAGEKRQDSDDVHNEAGWLSFSDEKKEWFSLDSPDEEADSRSFLSRTTRPLTFQHAGKTWTYHRPGDPMPCDGEREVVALLEDLDIGGMIRAGRFDWSQRDDGEQIIGWRYADEKKTVPLGPEDVRCGDEIMDEYQLRRCVITVGNDGVSLGGEGFIAYIHLTGRKIRRRDSDEFVPCSKETPA